jgi:hypothetical protein
VIAFVFQSEEFSSIADEEDDAVMEEDSGAQSRL